MPDASVSSVAGLPIMLFTTFETSSVLIFSNPPRASVTIAVTSSSLMLLRSPIVAYSPVASLSSVAG
jgi:hypothetical protein